MARVVKSFINGKYVAPRASAPSFTLLNATTRKPETSFTAADKAQVDEAVGAARSAQKHWRRLSPAERGSILRKAADILTAKTDEIATLETIDTGRPIAETIVTDVLSATDCLNYYGGVSPSVGGQHLELTGGSWAYTKREPLGVTAGIGAWNYPLQSAAWKSAPALAFGNSMVFKPSEETPLTALKLAEAYMEAGVPEGVFNVVLGAGETGQALVEHQDVAKVSFTGSVGTGRNVYAGAAKDLKKVTMELGGKSPLIVFDDADIEQAVAGAMMGNWYSSGQVCSNGTRVFVQRKIFDKFVQRMHERTLKLRIGDPLDPSTDIGPMIHEKHMKLVESYIEKGVAEGATLLKGGGERIMPSEATKDGFFLTPAIFVDCKDDMTIVREEIFGMVMCILPFDTEEEVLTRANDTIFGLSAGVFTKDITRAHRMIDELQAGTTWINNYNLAPVETPWGGYKKSGVGRENGLAGVDSWTQLKSVYVEMNEVWCPYAK
ncbi:betaine aldehyde dehydrogenase, variant [Phytophthora nicotianae INRA-310]|uniref:Betaine aldehyde dehydrogenase n=2 Tax=Phytophthora nicotianae TaxID=4792 RepID=W2QMY2_PHYN3|nr:betaine aldehyde dehydrogenase [Phytophthora nicotianae INRA-310]XP_008900691.1 betaine aldehyde dehydrogenase, variant [Phytophthora nicotianae INRA-310]ETM53147.1 betaine aldehyde dehydrogenase [Phytophthora nicotianae]KUF76396.1 Betaine aldehyde dehydrogenase [Phytophthora nicotianae]ETM53148.1 betaine aldehyde dehydrogenase, variant [Phytophthora nicotianae]ETN13609.1 betaine aldehyde dehydrogenase [Phytophthora nicotianae INRA-310]ETN13610.1 betaine aldehyde dehydrogenase, variant [Ph